VDALPGTDSGPLFGPRVVVYLAANVSFMPFRMSTLGRWQSYNEFGSGHSSARSFDKPVNGQRLSPSKRSRRRRRRPRPRPRPRRATGREWLTRQPQSQHFPLAGSALLSPSPTNATDQLLDRTTSKLLIHIRRVRGTRGLRPPGDSEAGEKNGQEKVETAKPWCPRENSKSAGALTDPRKHAGVRKKDQPDEGLVFLSGGPAGT
jgi:hypothetical protein